MKEKLSESRRCRRSASEACFNLLMGIYRTVTATVTVPIFVDPHDRPAAVGKTQIQSWHLTYCATATSDAAYLCAASCGASLSVASRNLDY